MIQIRNFTETDVASVASLVQKAGLSTTADYLRTHLLMNPSLSEGTSSASGIAIYEDEKCVAFQGVALKRIYVGQAQKSGCELTVLAIEKGHAHVIGDLIAAVMRPQGQAICYANTCMPQTVRLLKVAGMKYAGPPSCEMIRFYILKLGVLQGLLFAKRGINLPSLLISCANGLGRMLNVLFYRRARSKTVSERVTRIDDAPFKRFWREYVAGNAGVVTSRSPEELKWLFGEGLATGRFVMIARKRDERLVGYVVLKRHASESEFRWMVADWIALDNDPDVLHDLLLDARRFAATTEAFCLELTGFPMVIQPTVKACLPFARKALCNTFLYKPYDDSLKEALQQTPDKGWFWGPMDGDRCVN